MQWYVYLLMISAMTVLAWAALEVLWRPIRALLDLRRSVLEQMLAFENLSLPNPRETAVSSRQIHEYDQAMRNIKQAQYIFQELGSQLLAFGENEPVAAGAVASMGLHPVAAGNALVRLSVGYSRRDFDRAGLRSQVESALRLTSALPGDRHGGRPRDNGILRDLTPWSFRAAPLGANLGIRGRRLQFLFLSFRGDAKHRARNP
jgi:hypothetical protein